MANLQGDNISFSFKTENCYGKRVSSQEKSCSDSLQEETAKLHNRARTSLSRRVVWSTRYGEGTSHSWAMFSADERLLLG